MAKGLWLVKNKADITDTTIACFFTKQEAEEWAAKWMGPHTITYFEDT